MNKFYSVAYCFATPFCMFYPHKVFGKENIPDGAALVCANHTGYSDPLLAVFAFTRKNQLRFMAKKELFRVIGLGHVLKWAGIFPVDREGADVTAIKTAMRYLKAGEKVAIFPEGTAVRANEMVNAKTGAVRIAAKTGVPIVPVYIERKKKLFRGNAVVIGKPYTIQSDQKKLSTEDYHLLADELLEKINALEAVAR